MTVTEKMIQNSISHAADLLINQAENLHIKPEKNALASAEPLNELKQQLHQLSNLPLSQTGKFLIFFVTAYIEDIFSNLLTDTPYTENVKLAREKLFCEIGSLLKKLSGAYENGEDSTLYETYKELVHIYLEKIEFLNLKTRGTL